MASNISGDNGGVSLPLDYPELIALEALMQLMLHAAKNDEWVELSRIDEQRRALLDPDFEKLLEFAPATFTQDGAYTNLVDTIHKLDKEIVATVVQARDGLATENRVLRDQVKAKTIYQQTSAMNNDRHR